MACVERSSARLAAILARQTRTGDLGGELYLAVGSSEHMWRTADGLQPAQTSGRDFAIKGDTA
jgi:hypothetical protein